MVMEYQKNAFKKIEHNKVIDKLKEHAGSVLAKEIINELAPSPDFSEVKYKLDETEEARSVLRNTPNFAVGTIKDIRSFLEKLKINFILNPEDFLAIKDNIRTGKKIKKFFSNNNNWPILAKEVEKITFLNELENEISNKITEEGAISKNASLRLKELVNSIDNIQLKVKESLNKIINSSQVKKALQEDIITIRNNRYVIPIKQEYKSQVKGLIHDQSSSGATVFIEPADVVELNNKLKSLQSEYEKEIEKILRELTSFTSTYFDELKTNLNSLAKLDFIFAKAAYCDNIKGVYPEINNKGLVDIKNARHPLISNDEVVPISFQIGKEFNTVVITGPNTGGKTVALKTIGLLHAMAQSGIHIPCEEGSLVGIFEGIYADIGDEQSIEQSLSTFSSHMTNIIKIINNASSNSLVLLDELGAGTDPTEGAALAMAILSYFHEKGSKTIATTHFSRLKNFAYNTPGVQNASVEFDVNTLRPTYRLLMGVPGKSNAFDISLRLGLDINIIERAKEFMTAEEIQASQMIQKLEEDRKVSEKDREEAELAKKEIDTLKEELQRKKIELERRKKEILENAVKEAKDIVKRTQKESKEIIKSLHFHNKDIQDSQKKLKELDDYLKEKSKEAEEPTSTDIPKSVEAGDTIYVPKLNKRGIVINFDNDQGEVQVQIGAMKVTLEMSELREVPKQEREEKNQESQKQYISVTSTHNNAAASAELNLRGDKVEEAVEKIENFFDHACLVGLKEVSLIHGKGTGALRTGIREYLKRHSNVKNFRYGKPEEGGDGVTIVELR